MAHEEQGNGNVRQGAPAEVCWTRTLSHRRCEGDSTAVRARHPASTFDVTSANRFAGNPIARTARTESFGAAAAQLGGDQAPVRLAGVYAMAALADEWEERRQQCVDVLCGYLRIPYVGDPPPGHPEVVIEQRQYNDGTMHRTETITSYRPGELQVRRAIVETIKQHVQQGVIPSWSGYDFDFSGASLHDAEFRDAVFDGRTVFDRAKFTGEFTSFEGRVSPDRPRLVGPFSPISVGTMFAGTQFDGGAWFGVAQFAAPATDFDEARFGAGSTAFDGAEFTADRTWFPER